jgi:hypothetical protein
VKVAFGLKAHSGWAVLVVVGEDGRTPRVLDRRRIDLVEATWAKAPYHAAEEMTPAKAAGLVKRATEMARRVAEEKLRLAADRARKEGQDVAACAVLVPNPMPPWTVEEIRAVHFRMHKAEGVLFPEALVHGAKACGLSAVTVPEKTLDLAPLASLAKPEGPPWGKDQKAATVAALIALRSATRTAPRAG